MCAMLPLLVGGPELALTARFLFSLFAEFHDQLPKVSLLELPLMKGCGGVAGREWAVCWEAFWSEYEDSDSLMRWSSAGARFGDDGHCVDGGPDPANGEGLGCHPCARISAEVWRLARLLGGSSTLARGWGPGGGAGGPARSGDVAWVVAPPIDP
jgi:hypothetical protein